MAVDAAVTVVATHFLRLDTTVAAVALVAALMVVVQAQGVAWCTITPLRVPTTAALAARLLWALGKSFNQRLAAAQAGL